jgi:putative membrane protein
MTEPTRPGVDPTAFSDADRVSIELSSRRTGMSFQRTRMSADRTLMSVIRTALSLIGFGFTIYQFFGHMVDSKLLPDRAPHNFGIALVALGITMLVLGIIYHLAYMRGLRLERSSMKAEGLIHGETKYPVSMTLIVAVLLLALGLLAVTSMIFNVGPFD